MESHWKGKKVAFIGDSITDPEAIPTVKKYWKFLEEQLGIEPFVFGINGANWSGALGQAMKMQATVGDDIDAIFIFMGTNDYNGATPLGEWFTILPEETNDHGHMQVIPHRHIIKDNNTVRGRINTAMEFLKENFPFQQIVLMTPIHRAFPVSVKKTSSQRKPSQTASASISKPTSTSSAKPLTSGQRLSSTSIATAASDHFPPPTHSSSTIRKPTSCTQARSDMRESQEP